MGPLYFKARKVVLVEVATEAARPPMQQVDKLSDPVAVRALSLVLESADEPSGKTGALVAPGLFVRWNVRRTAKEIHHVTDAASADRSTLLAKVYNDALVFYAQLRVAEKREAALRLWQHLLRAYRSDFALYRSRETGRAGLVREAGMVSGASERAFYDELDAQTDGAVSVRVPLRPYVWRLPTSRAPAARAATTTAPLVKQRLRRRSDDAGAIDATTAAGSLLR